MCQAVILVQDVHAKLLQSCPTLWVYELWSARLLCPWGTLGNNAGVAIGCHALVLAQDQSVQFSSVTQSCPTLCDPMNRSTPSLPVHYQLPVYSNSCPSCWWCHPAISSLSSPSPLALNPSQHQGLCKWVNSLHEVAKVPELQLQHQSFQWTPRTDLL